MRQHTGYWEGIYAFDVFFESANPQTHLFSQGLASTELNLTKFYLQLWIYVLDQIVANVPHLIVLLFKLFGVKIGQRWPLSPLLIHTALVVLSNTVRYLIL